MTRIKAGELLSALRNHARRAERSAVWPWVLLPMLLALLWGPRLPPDGYHLTAAARNLAAGRAASFGLDWTTFAPWRYPLPLLLLTGMERLSLPLIPTLWLLGAAGWSLATYALARAVRTLGRPAAAPAAAALVAFAPWVTHGGIGLEGWIVAASWGAVSFALQRRRRAQVGALALWLGIAFDWPAWLGVTAFLLGSRLLEKRFSWELALLWGLATLGLVGRWTLLDLPPLSLAWGGSAMLDAGRAWLVRDFYWLLVPLALLGALTGGPLLRFVLLGWAVAALGSGDAGAVAGLYAGGIAAVGVGCAWLVEYGWRVRRPYPARVNSARGALLLALPLLLAQGAAFYAAYRARPVALHTLEIEAGRWVRAHSQPEDVVWGNAHAGVVAQRPLIAWEVGRGDGAALAQMLAALSFEPPAFCISSRSLAWESVIHTGWFNERYSPVQRFESLTDAEAPLTVWRYQAEGYDRGELRTIDLPVGDDLRVVGYRRWPPSLQPGEAVYLTLYLRAEAPVGEASRAIVRVFSPISGENFAQVEHPLPGTIPVEWWAPGERVAERFVLTTTATTPVGAYHLDLSVPGTEIQGARLAYVSVPWEGAIPPEAVPIDAHFEGGVRLAAAGLPEALSPGAEVEITLYWEAEAALAEDVTVFVHLLGPDGTRVTGDDGMPMQGRYPTGAWQPGDRIPDPHSFSLPEDLPPGPYHLTTGLYRAESLERLVVETEDGVLPSDRAVVLRSYTLP